MILPVLTSKETYRYINKDQPMSGKNVNDEEKYRNDGIDGSITCHNSNKRALECQMKMGIRYIPAYS